MTTLPPGFVLDEQSAPQGMLPDGFALDAAPVPQRSAMDRLTGTGGERYQTWPERLIRGIGSSIKSGATLPGDVYSGQAQLPSSGAMPGSVPFGDANSAGSRVADLAMMASPAAPSVGRSVIPPAVPTIEQIKGAARAGYQSPEVTGLAVKPSTVAEFARTTKAQLNAEGLDDVVAKSAFDVLSKLEKAPPGSFVTGQSLDSLRKTLGNVAKERSPTGDMTPSALAANRAIEGLDSFIPNIASRDVVAGDVAAAGKTWETARANWSAAKGAQTIDQKTIQAELRAAAAHSGYNVANTVRQRMADILIKPQLQRGFTSEELAAMEGIVRGTTGENALRFSGKWLGGGGGLGSLATSGWGAAAGAAVGGPLGAAIGGVTVPAIGFGLNALSNRMTLKQAERLSELVRSRAPLAKSMEAFGEKAGAYSQMTGPKTAASLMIAARNLSNNLKDAGINMSPADIFRAVQGPIKGAAEDDKTK